jgi:hypothetical protein
LTIRQQLSVEQPQLCKFLDDMKAGFDSVVLYVSAPGIEAGKEPPAGVKPYIPVSPTTWDYEVGQSPSSKTAKTASKKGRKR